MVGELDERVRVIAGLAYDLASLNWPDLGEQRAEQVLGHADVEVAHVEGARIALLTHGRSHPATQTSSNSPSVSDHLCRRTLRNTTSRVRFCLRLFVQLRRSPAQRCQPRKLALRLAASATTTPPKLPLRHATSTQKMAGLALSPSLARAHLRYRRVLLSEKTI